ncbi:hypothetical protein T484DRAFT_1607563, partial [Baffinella frigidus]
RTLNPQPSTLNPQPSTLNPQPSTLNPQPSTLNPQPSTLNLHPLTLNPQPSTLNPHPSTLKANPKPESSRSISRPAPPRRWCTRRRSPRASPPPETAPRCTSEGAGQSSSASVGATDCSQVDVLGSLYSTNPSTLARKRARAHQIGVHK